MKYKLLELVDALNRFNEAVQNFGKTLQQIKEHDKKYEYFYAKENVSRKQTIE